MTDWNRIHAALRQPPPSQGSADLNPYVRAFFNLTAGLEKFIIAVLAAFAAYVTAVDAAVLTDAQKALIVALLGAVQVLYTSSSNPTPPAK